MHSTKALLAIAVLPMNIELYISIVLSIRIAVSIIVDERILINYHTIKNAINNYIYIYTYIIL